MGRLRGLVVAGCLLLAACSGERAGPRHAVIDYKDFIKLGGTMYYVADHGVGRSIERGDLVGLPRFDGQGGCVGQATCLMGSARVVVSNSSGVM
jgi:hypothetical protein